MMLTFPFHALSGHPGLPLCGKTLRAYADGLLAIAGETVTCADCVRHMAMPSTVVLHAYVPLANGELTSLCSRAGSNLTPIPLDFIRMWGAHRLALPYEAVTCRGCLLGSARDVWTKRLQRGFEAIAYAASCCPFCGTATEASLACARRLMCLCHHDEGFAGIYRFGVWLGPQSGVSRATGVGVSGPTVTLRFDDQSEPP